MTELFNTANHQPPNNTSWSCSVVRKTILSIIADFNDSQLHDASWPTHPLDGEVDVPLWTQWNGAAGAVVALRILSSYGYGSANLSKTLTTIYTNYLSSIHSKREPGLHLGETGIIAPMVLSGIADKKLVSHLRHCMRQCAGHPAYEITSGAAGMMHAALTLYSATNNEIWRDHFRDGAYALIDAWILDPGQRYGLWKSEVFSESGIPPRHYYGACHGIVGNIGAVLRGIDLLDEISIDTLIARTTTALQNGAIHQGELTNWPISVEPTKSHLLVQWCHGASGIVTALGNLPKTDKEHSKILDNLLLQAGELIWKAGPLTKGPGICHGTAGNGYAFLTLYKRTKEKKWLARAKTFAMHSIDQYLQSKEHYGRGRYTLWTGDGGVAIYLHHCLAIDPGCHEFSFPGLEKF